MHNLSISLQNCNCEDAVKITRDFIVQMFKIDIEKSQFGFNNKI